MEEIPFPDLKIDTSDFMDSLNGRSKCSKCEKSRKYYCYNCYIPVPEIEDKVPTVKLPIKIDVIKHPSEVDGKSTAVHAAVIAPDDVTVYTYPCIPDYDIDKTVLVFPGESSITLADLAHKLNGNSNKSMGKRNVCSDHEDSGSPHKRSRLESTEISSQEKLNEENVLGKEDKQEEKSCDNLASEQTCGSKEKENNDGDRVSAGNSDNKQESQTLCSGLELVPSCKLERVVFVDSTWNQTKTICSDERLRGLQCIELKTRETKFWRHQKDIPNTYLSTIEAIYYFLREFHEQFVLSRYSGQYDNLLFFFSYMYKKIRTLYDGGSDLKAYKERTVK
ncbi:tRNA-uridine aminocarboxypropyltransferase 1-like [Ruditapes philippinarum]|uniref:tRNA-uridine aminocarboxypropyltransferase 1-like n=1 Tax=Ruditapes philippinarum TaxID=129788 RepID=UPI00295B4943|nr:tRNA-uridine aminocarboxypropyltransferase 1-like [Ruditapes philippinarum]